MSKNQDQVNAIVGGFVLIFMVLLVAAGVAGVVQLWMWVLQ